MQQIYRHTDEQFEIYTTVFSPQVCRTRTRIRPVEPETVVVMVTQHQSNCPQELNLNQGDRIQVLFKEDEERWFGQSSNGDKGFFPVSCVEPLQGDGSRPTPTLARRGSVPATVAPCGCTSGHNSPKLLRKNSLLRPLGLDGPPGGSGGRPHGSPSLLHRVLAKSRRKSCPHLPPPPAESGSFNTAFQPD